VDFVLDESDLIMIQHPLKAIKRTILIIVTLRRHYKHVCMVKYMEISSAYFQRRQYE